MSVKIKKIKCPDCGLKIDPDASTIAKIQTHCMRPKCGLERIVLSKFLPDEIEVLDYEEPMVIYVHSSKDKIIL